MTNRKKRYVYLAYSIRYSKSAQISMDKMSESISNRNGGSDKDVGSDSSLCFKIGGKRKRKKKGWFNIHEQDEMSFIVQSNTLINPCFEFYVRGLQLV